MEALKALEAATEKLEHYVSERDHLKESVIPPEVKQAMADIDTEFSIPIREFETEVYELTELVKREALEMRHTIKGNSLMAVYTPEGYSWDTRRLEGYAQANKDLWNLAKPKSPAVSIRKIK